MVTNKDKAKNMAQVAKGEGEEVAGKPRRRQARSRGQRRPDEGNMKQAGEKIKDAFKK